MLKINNIDVESLDLERPTVDEMRNVVDWCNRPDKRFLQAPDASYFYREVYPSDFKVDQTSFNFVKKGCRPTFNHKLFDTYDPGSYYIIKFTNKVVALCNADIPYTTDIVDLSHENVLKILGTADQDLKYVFVEMCGAGGGGAGGVVSGGNGGQSGGYISLCLKLIHDPDVIQQQPNSTFFAVGKGGQGSKGHNKANDGWASGTWRSDGYCYCAAGGSGSKDATCQLHDSWVGRRYFDAQGRVQYDTAAIPYMRPIVVVQGQAPSYTTGSHIRTEGAISQYTPELTQDLKRGRGLDGYMYNSYAWSGGAGGNSPLGQGGDGGWRGQWPAWPGEIRDKDHNIVSEIPAGAAREDYKVGPGTGGGGGGGGGGKSLNPTSGAPGAHGYLAIYY